MYSEAFFGGMLTTVIFAIMMRASDQAVGATHYTALSGEVQKRGADCFKDALRFVPAHQCFCHASH